MEITLSKILPYLVYPFNLALWCLAFAWITALFRRRKWAGFFLTVGLCILGVASSPRIGETLLAELEQRYPPVAVADTPSADAIVVLGGGLNAPLPPRLTVELNQSADRLLHALRLYRAGKAPRIILSGGNVFPQKNIEPESVYASQLLQSWGVPAQAILIEGKSRNTYQNALETKILMAANNLHKLLLVTSASHMPRAYAVFRRAGIDAIPVTTDFVVVKQERPEALDWIPSLGALGFTTAAVHERIGMWYYRLRGWSD